jgi:hypothetical protein
MIHNHYYHYSDRVGFTGYVIRNSFEIFAEKKFYSLYILYIMYYQMNIMCIIMIE